MNHSNLKKLVAIASISFAAVLTPMSVNASPILPGYDLFYTPNFIFNVPTIGNTEMQGVAFGPGNTDTIVHRIDGIDPFNSPTGSGIVNIELIALSLRSVAPVFGPSANDYLWIIVNEDITKVDPSLVPATDQSSSSGQMEIRHEFPDDPNTLDSDGYTLQGTFDVGLGSLDDFLVTAEIWSGSATSALIDLNLTDTVIQNGTGSWSHTQPFNYPETNSLPAGNFYVRNNPAIFDDGKIDHDGPHPTLRAVPEPTYLMLLLSALTLLSLKLRVSRVSKR
ncbi:MAG: hypothetical protein methR_P2295 [Methyloprofundus sp.]|nr:MAG: hypothetical protein methR_P2295 [Methyloprofundus sp.]